MSLKQHPRIEDIVWAELLIAPVKRRITNKSILDQFASHGWVKPSSRRNELQITEGGRKIAATRLAKQWPNWRENIEQFAAAGLSPEDSEAWQLLKRSEAGQVPRTLSQVNRRTLAAWERRHSKVAGMALSDTFTNARVTIDEIVRMRLPPKSKFVLKSGEMIDCDWQMRVFGEIDVSERGWDNVLRIEAPQSKVVVSIENKGAFVDFPNVESATLVFVPGDNLSALRRVVSLIAKQPLLHFGDLDPEGIDIYWSIASELSVAQFIPSYASEYIETHARLCDTAWQTQQLPSLHPLIAQLASCGRWLEQEALVLDHRFETEVEFAIEQACSKL